MNKVIISRDQALALITPASIAKLNCSVMVLGIRGWADAPGQNKKGIFDDAIVLVTPDECIALNGNTDPSIDQPGMAVLQDGDYWYRYDLHGVHHLTVLNTDSAAVAADKRAKMNQLRTTGKDIPGYTACYYALRQDGPVTVLRDGAHEPETITDPAHYPMIDIHAGGEWTTSSEGCQTIYRPQWHDFIDPCHAAMIKYGHPRIPYCLRTKTA